MNRLRYLALALVIALGCCISPSSSMASLVYYTAAGSLVDNQGRTLQIDGEVYIDDQLRDVSGQPTEINNQVGIFFYNYSITGYALSIGAYSFAGNSGSLFTPLIRYPTLDDWDFGDLMWSLEGGESNSQWSTWYGDGFIFCNPDGTPRDPSEYCSLADVINLVEIMDIAGDPILSEPHPPFDLWLVKNNTAAPAPEPTAIVLFGAGLLGMALKRKKLRPGVLESADDTLLS